MDATKLVTQVCCLEDKGAEPGNHAGRCNVLDARLRAAMVVVCAVAVEHVMCKVRRPLPRVSRDISHIAYVSIGQEYI